MKEIFMVKINMNGTGVVLVRKEKKLIMESVLILICFIVLVVIYYRKIQ